MTPRGTFDLPPWPSSSVKGDPCVHQVTAIAQHPTSHRDCAAPQRPATMAPSPHRASLISVQDRPAGFGRRGPHPNSADYVMSMPECRRLWGGTPCAARFGGSSGIDSGFRYRHWLFRSAPTRFVTRRDQKLREGPLTLTRHRRAAVPVPTSQIDRGYLNEVRLSGAFLRRLNGRDRREAD